VNTYIFVCEWWHSYCRPSWQQHAPLQYVYSHTLALSIYIYICIRQNSFLSANTYFYLSIVTFILLTFVTLARTLTMCTHTHIHSQCISSYIHQNTGTHPYHVYTHSLWKWNIYLYTHKSTGAHPHHVYTLSHSHLTCILIYTSKHWRAPLPCVHTLKLINRIYIDIHIKALAQTIIICTHTHTHTQQHTYWYIRRNSQVHPADRRGTGRQVCGRCKHQGVLQCVVECCWVLLQTSSWQMLTLKCVAVCCRVLLQTSSWRILTPRCVAECC